jgi:hypothetical protein
LDARSAAFGAIIKRAFGIGLAAELHMRVICMTMRHARHGIALMIVLPLWLTAASASAQNRADRPGSDTGTTAVARPSSPAPAPAPTPAPGRAAATPADRGERSGSSGGGTTSAGGGTTSAGGDTGSGRRRDRGDEPVVGRAEPRPVTGRPTGGGTVILVPDALYPWGYGGLGLGGYYGGYYDPGYGYGGGGYPTYTPPQRDIEGAVRIKVTPREASVYVDGYYVGHVDDFDGVMQKLHLSEGPHRIELRDPKYEPLTFDVRIDTDQTITYRGEMKKIQ